jgi:hypothetical protein
MLYKLQPLIIPKRLVILAVSLATGWLHAQDEAAPKPASGENLALNRPVTVSSTDWAPTPAEFAVDGETDTGWRAADGDEQWIAVDLQGACTITGFRLVSEATRDAKPYPGKRGDTTGNELLSSCATDYAVQVSKDGKTWANVLNTTEGRGGSEDITLTKTVSARRVRVKISKRSSPAPIGINELKVLGSCGGKRPIASGWTTRRIAKRSKKPALALAADGTVPLESGWELICENWLDNAGGAMLSKSGIDTGRWYDATVPGTVLGTLVDQGVFQDPAYGLDNLRIPEALCRRSWWYRRAFSVPAGMNTTGRLQWLELDGIHHSAEVWFNGSKLGSMNAFQRGNFDITSLLKTAGENVLALRFVPQPYPGSPGDKGTDGVAWVNSMRMCMNAPSFVCTSGWDWIPAIRDRACGILDSVRLRSSGPVLIGDLQVETKLPIPTDTSLANLSLTIPVRNASAQEQRVTLKATITPDQAQPGIAPIVLSQEIILPAGASLDAEFTPARFPALAIRNPRLWWPNGYGRPDLQRLSVEAACAGATSDSRAFRFGMRELHCRAEGMDQKGKVIDFPATQARYVRIFCKERATDYGDSLWNFSVFDHNKPDADLALKHPATSSSNENDERVAALAMDGDRGTRWASAYSDPQWISVDLGDLHTVDRVTLAWQAAAKSYVIQVSLDGQTWTDVKSVTYDPQSPPDPPEQMQLSVNGVRIFCRGGNWGYDELLRRGGQTRMDAAVRLHRDCNFNMIRNWMGCVTRPEFYRACDENGILVFNDFYVFDYGAERQPLCLETASETILRYRHHPSIAFWCGCNEGFPPKVIDDGLRSLVARHDGQRSYFGHSAFDPLCGFGPYGWVDPKNYAEIARGFKSEIGIPTVPVAESMRRLAGDQPAWPIGAVWNYHDWSPAGGQDSNKYRDAIQARLGDAKDLDDFCGKAQFVNYESMRAIYESWNHKLWKDCAAVLIWMSHPAWMSTTWQTYDYDFEVNGSYFGAKKACEPVHIQAMLTDGSVDALNHTAQAIAGATATATSYDLNGKRLGESQTQRVDLPASSVTPVFNAAWPDGEPPLHLLRLELRDRAGKLLSENTYWRYSKPEEMQTLNTLAPTTLNVSVTAKADGPRTVLTANLSNSGTTVAAMVTLSLRRARDVSRVLPAFHSDGDLWLLPNETRTVTIECATRDLKGEPPALQVSGYNLPTRTIKAGR